MTRKSVRLLRLSTHMCVGMSFALAACSPKTAPGGSAADSGSSVGGQTGAGTAATRASGGGTVAGSGASAAVGGSTAAQASGGPGGAAADGGGAGATGNSAGTTGTAGSPATTGAKFSFFVTSYAAMQRLSGSPDGFGGNLTFNQSDGLSGADQICRQIAETSLPGAGQMTWRAFLSVTKGSKGKPVNAIDRVGNGPWYDRLGRLLAMNKADLAQPRPTSADSAIIDDFPNEDGVPNHAPDSSSQVDNHDILTGSSDTGTLYDTDWSVTCHDWTSSVGSDGKPRVGHSWPRSGRNGMGNDNSGNGMNNWMSALSEAGCAAGASLIEMGGPDSSNPTVGSGGGYGGIYCFALTP
jgi:hypothetical protein